MCLRPGLEAVHPGVYLPAFCDEIIVTDTVLDAVCIGGLDRFHADVQTSEVVGYLVWETHSHTARMFVHCLQRRCEHVRYRRYRAPGATGVRVCDPLRRESIADDDNALPCVSIGRAHDGKRYISYVVNSLKTSGVREEGAVRRAASDAQ